MTSKGDACELAVTLTSLKILVVKNRVLHIHIQLANFDYR